MSESMYLPKLSNLINTTYNKLNESPLPKGLGFVDKTRIFISSSHLYDQNTSLDRIKGKHSANLGSGWGNHRAHHSFPLHQHSIVHIFVPVGLMREKKMWTAKPCNFVSIYFLNYTMFVLLNKYFAPKRNARNITCYMVVIIYFLKICISRHIGKNICWIYMR